MRNKYYVSLKTQFENMGDLLINREMIKLLSLHGDVYINCSSAPSDFIEKILPDIQNKCIQLNTKLDLIGFYLKAVLGIFSTKNKYVFAQNPGGYGGEISEKIMSRKKINSKIKATLTLFGVDFVAFGISYDKIGPRHISILKGQYQFYKKHYVRDQRSYEFCVKNGIKCDGILPDLAFNLNYKPQLTTSSNNIVLSFRELESQTLDCLLIESIIRNVTHLCKETGSKNISIIYQVTFDKDFSEKIAEALRFDKSLTIEVIDLTKSITENLNTYSKAKYTLTNRLHVLLMSMSVGSKSYALTHPVKNEKLVNLLNSENLGKSIISITEDDKNPLDVNSNQDYSNIFKENQKILNSAKI